MNPTPTLITGLIVASLPANAALFPNGDFESGGASWQDASGEGTYVFDYPGSGGNPNAYGVIDNSAGGGGFGVLVADDGQIMSLESLGLTAGQTYRFSQDMILLSGPNLGGFKVDFFTNDAPTPGRPSTGDLFPEPINGAATWERYDFFVTIPADTDGIKVVPLWGADSSVGFDNVQVDTTPIDTGVIQNSDFSLGGLGWSEIGAQTTWSYPSSGGNPGGYGVMTNDGGGFGIWIANDNQTIPFADLGLVPGDTAVFQQDMIILSGENVGGLKIDFFSGPDFVGSTGDIDPPVIGDGSTWETYTFPILIPEEIDGSPVDGLKIVPLEGQGSSVGYDNISWTVQPRPIEATAAGNLVEGTLVFWNPTNPAKIHQPQRSEDGANFVDFGPAYPGTDTTSLLDPNSAPFYRVIEKDPAGENALYNGGFELEDFLNPECPDGWQCLTNRDQPPTLTSDDVFAGEAAIRIAVQNDNTPVPNQGEIQQNLGAAGGFVVGGETYTLSFWAKQLNFGVSYVQRYQLQWFGTDGPLTENIIPFTDFSGGDNAWTQVVSQPVTAPDEAVGLLLQIFGSTGAVAGADARGEVLIDEVALVPGTLEEPAILETTQEPGIGIYARTRPGQRYQAQVSEDLENFDDLSGIFTGNGEPVGAGTIREGDTRFYLLRELPEQGQ